MSKRPARRLDETQIAALEAAVTAAGSQGALAGSLGCTQQTISKLRTGELGVSAEMALRLDALGGALVKHMTRPDLFAAPRTEAAA